MWSPHLRLEKLHERGLSLVWRLRKFITQNIAMLVLAIFSRLDWRWSIAVIVMYWFWKGFHRFLRKRQKQKAMKWSMSTFSPQLMRSVLPYYTTLRITGLALQEKNSYRNRNLADIWQSLSKKCIYWFKKITENNVEEVNWRFIDPM